MKLDHVNIKVRDLDKMCKFYADVLGLKAGYRPSFAGAPGAWLYNQLEQPVVHLSLLPPNAERSGRNLDHFAFRTDDLAEVIQRLDSHGIEFKADEISETSLKQIFFDDPEGGQVEVNSVI